MPKTALTYGLLDKRLRALGFAAYTQQGKARIYRHEQTGASIILPDARFDEEVLPRHLVVARRVLKDHDLGDLDEGQVNPAKLPPLTPEDIEMLRRPVERVERQGKQIRSDHQGGGVFFWWLLRPEDLVRRGHYEAGKWVVVANWGPFMPREGYPIEEESVPAEVRALRSAGNHQDQQISSDAREAKQAVRRP